MRRALLWVGIFVVAYALLFAVRFVAFGHYLGVNEQECHIGGIAHELLAHGVSMPLRNYAPNDYNSGSFFFGATAAAYFSLLGPSLLAVKLVPHTFAVAGLCATLALLARSLRELSMDDLGVRALAISVFAAAMILAPRLVIGLSMYAAANHAEGSALGLVALALFAVRLERPRPWIVAGVWAATGLFLYVAKGCAIAVAVMAAGEALRWRRGHGVERARELGYATLGFAVGASPILGVPGLPGDAGGGWDTIAEKLARHAAWFPYAWLDSVLELGHRRPLALVLWAAALSWAGLAACKRRSIALALLTGYAGVHLGALSIMAQGGFDQYAIYSYPAIAAVSALAAARLTMVAAARFGRRTGLAVAASAVPLTLALGYPTAGLNHTPGAQLEWLLAMPEAGVCSWRFAEGFLRESPTPHERSEEPRAAERCRQMMSGRAQQLDCIAGISRARHWRWDLRVDGPPSGLGDDEELAYAFGYGTHRRGDTSFCADFEREDLRASCESAAHLECLVWGDTFMRALAQAPIRRPTCELTPPPPGSFWGAVHEELMSRPEGARPSIPVELLGDDGDIGGCERTFALCY